MSTFRPYEPEQQLLLPPSLREWLPPDHLVWFISETVDQWNLDTILEKYRDGGQGNLPVPRTALGELFVQVILIAGEAGLVKMGTLAVGGSKMRANASKRKAMSYERMQQEERRLGKEIRAQATKRMAARLRTKRGRSKYQRRKHIAEPPFGWIKRGLGFRQFRLRGIGKVTGEFNLICLALNLRRMANMIRWA